MIISEQKQDVQISGGFKTSGFKIQASSKAFDILSSNIYTHKVRAVIREISCNAVDAHAAAGNPDCIHVHLPTRLEPHFSVRDYGTGLSDEDVREIFTTYFCSTKTSSNDFVGALGLGSKSPFCIVDSFTVKSFFNGAANLYSCYRDENGEPQVALLTSNDTDEPNGVEVSMAIDENMIQQFADEAEHVYFYFTRTPHINKQSVVDAINSRKAKVKISNNDVCVETFNGWNSLKAVMGGVAYDIPSNIETPFITGYLKFKMGEISFDAGRESLSLDEKTVNAIKSKTELLKSNIRDSVLDIIQSEPTDFLRARKADELRNAPGVKSSDLNPFWLPNTKTGITYYAKTGWRGAVDIGETSSLPIGDNIKYFRHKPRFGARIKSFIKDGGASTVVLLTDEQIAESKIDLDFVEDLDTLPKVEKTTKRGRSYQKQSGILFFNGSESWKVGDRWDDADSIPAGEKVYVQVHRNEPEDSSWSQIKLCHSLGITIYGIKKPFMQTKSFESGGWISIAEYMKKSYKSMVDNMFFPSDLSSYEDRDLRHYIVKAKGDGHTFTCERVNAFLDENTALDSTSNASLRNIADTFMWEYKEEKTLDKLMQDVKMNHPMLEYFKIGYRDDDTKANQTLADYLNRKEC
jgi:hypothetical protein